MKYETDTRGADRGETDVLAAWEVYMVTIAGLVIYSLLSALV